MSLVNIESKRVMFRKLESSDAPALGMAMRDGNISETTTFEPPARTSDEGTERALKGDIDDKMEVMAKSIRTNFRR